MLRNNPVVVMGGVAAVAASLLAPPFPALARVVDGTPTPQACEALGFRPARDCDRYPSVQAAPEATRFAIAVAAFGQKLKGDTRLDRDYDWSAIRTLAQGARGDDPFGIRAEFVQLTRAAEEKGD